MKQLVRRLRDSSEGRVYNVYYDTTTGKYSQVREGREEEEEQNIEDSSWHVQGYRR